jgi:hypothetical protein
MSSDVDKACSISSDTQTIKVALQLFSFCIIVVILGLLVDLMRGRFYIGNMERERSFSL